MQAQTTYFSQSTTDLHLLSNWNDQADGSGSAPLNFTSNDQIFLIDDEGTASIGANWVVSGTGSRIVVGNGQVFNSNTFSITGTIDVNAGATFNYDNVATPFTLGTCDATSTVVYNRNGNQNIAAGTYGNLSLTTGGTKTALGNLVVNGTLTTSRPLALSTFTLSGTLTGIAGTQGITTSSIAALPLPEGKTWTQTITYNANADQNIVHGSYVSLLLNGTTGTKFFDTDDLTTIRGAFTIQSTVTIDAASSSVQLSGAAFNINFGGVDRTFGKLYINGTGDKTLINGTGGLHIMDSLSISTGRTLVMNDNVLTMEPTALLVPNQGGFNTTNTSLSPLPSSKLSGHNVTYSAASGTQTILAVQYNNLTISGAGDKTLASSGTIQVRGTLNISTTGTFTTTSSRLELNGTTTQTITLGANRTFPKFIISEGTTKTVTSAALELDITDSLFITSTATLAMGTNALDVNSAGLGGTGTITTTNTSAAPITDNIIWPYSVSYIGSTGTVQQVMRGTYVNLTLTSAAATGEKVLSSTGDIIVTGNLNLGNGNALITTTGSNIVMNSSTLQTLTIGAAKSLRSIQFFGTGAKTISGAFLLTVNDVLDISATSTLNLSTASLNVTGATLNGTGTLTTANTGATPLSASITWPYRVRYIADANQTVVGGTYQNLDIVSPGVTARIKTASGDITVIDTLSLTTDGVGGITLAMSSNLLDDGIGFTVLSTGIGTGAKTITTQNTSTEPIPANKNWPTNVTYNAVAAQSVVSGIYELALNVDGGDRTFSPTGTIEVRGNYTASTGTATYTWVNSTFNFSGGNQTLTFAASPVYNFENVSFTGSGTKTVAGGGFNANEDLTIAANVTLNMATFAMGGLPNTPTTGTGTILTQSLVNPPLPLGITWSQKVIYNTASAGQVISSGTYSNLELILPGATARTKTVVGGDVTVNDTLTLNAQGTAIMTLAMSTFRLIAGGGFVLNNVGIPAKHLTTAYECIGAEFPFPQGQTWPGNVTMTGLNMNVPSGVYTGNLNLSVAGANRVFDNSDTIEIQGNFTANGASSTYTTTGTTFIFSGGAQTLTFLAASPINFENISFTGTSVIKTIAGAGFGVNGTLNIGSTVILNMATFSMSGNPTSISGSGQINTQAGTAALPTGETWPYTVNYNFNGTQEVISGTYQNLSLSITSGSRVRNATGNITVNSIFEVDAPSGTTLTFNLQTFDLIPGMSFSADFSSDGTKNFTTASTSSTPLPSGLGWPNTVTYNSNTGSGSQTVVSGTYNNLTLSGITNKHLVANTVVSGTLVFNTNARLELNAFDLEIQGAVTNTTTQGIVGHSSSSISCINAIARTLSFDQSTPGTTNIIRNLTVNTPGVATTIGNSLQIASNGIVTVTDGILACGANNLRLLSTSATASAQIGTVGATGSITGTMTVERFIPAGTRNWRFMASSVNTTSGIDAAWQQGIHITGSGTGGTVCGAAHSNGFDATSSNSPSMYTWDATTQSWVSVPNTSTENLQTGVGYRIMYRGNRSQGCSLIDGTNPPPTPIATTLTATGTPVFGNQLVTCASSFAGWTLVGNPYQSSLSLSLINRSANLSTRFFVFDPVFNNYRQFNVFDNVGTGAFAGNGRLAPGQAFYIQTVVAGAASITFEESDKAPTITPAAFFKNDQNNLLNINLFGANNEYISDALVTNFVDSKWSNDLHDGELFPLATEQLGTFTDDNASIMEINSVSSLPFEAEAKIYIDISRPIKEAGNYRIGFSRLPEFMKGHQLVLFDAFANKTIPFNDELSYNFTTTTDPASRSNKRLQLIVRNTASDHQSLASLSDATIKIYPNPANESLKILVSTGVNENTTISVVDMMGKSYNLPLSTNAFEADINVESLRNGVYFVIIEENNTRRTVKFIKQ
jgi:hypothetical protein